MRLYFQFLLFFAVLTPFCAAQPGDWREFVGPETTARLESVDTIPAAFYVSPDGNDAWSGRLAAPNAEKTDGPFRSLEKARDAVRDLRANTETGGTPTVVELRPGFYPRETPLKLTGADSGDAASPVIWRGTRDAEGNPLAEIRGGKTITGGKPVEDAGALARLQPKVHDKILEFDLKALGITDYGKLDGSDSAELFLNNQPMTIARYPNEGFMKYDAVEFEGNQEIKSHGIVGVAKPKLLLPNADLSLWAKEPDAWVLGYWFWDWSNCREKIARIDVEKGLLELAPPYHGYGYRPGQYFYAYHALCELDMPGEYYIDNETGKLYFYPPEEVTESNLFLSMAPSLIAADGVSYLTISGLAFNGCRQEAVSISGSDNLICGSLIRNTGANGVNIGGGRNLCFGNHIYNIGSSGIRIDSGDRASLTAGKSAVVNNDVHHFSRVNRMYTPAVALGGCGNLVAQNRLTDAPHSAIIFNGNDQRIERNEIARVCEESNDAGAVYTGRNWTMRGNVIRQNYLHDISGFERRGCVGVYLDDMFSSADIVENLFVRVTCAIMIGGGRDNSVVNNLFVDCRPNLHIDQRALGWASGGADAWIAEFKEKGTISGIDIKSELWAAKYPALAAMMESRDPKAPEGNVVERNLIIATENGPEAPRPFTTDAGDKEARQYCAIRDNVEGDARLLLEVCRNGDAPIPGTGARFTPIPTEKIGLFKGCGAISR